MHSLKVALIDLRAALRVACPLARSLAFRPQNVLSLPLISRKREKEGAGIPLLRLYFFPPKVFPGKWSRNAKPIVVLFFLSRVDSEEKGNSVQGGAGGI